MSDQAPLTERIKDWLETSDEGTYAYALLREARTALEAQKARLAEHESTIARLRARIDREADKAAERCKSQRERAEAAEAAVEALDATEEGT